MTENIVYILIYLLTEFVNYFLAYVIIFQAGINKRKISWILSIGFILVVHGTVLCVAGLEAALSLSVLTMLVIPTFLLDDREKNYFLLYPFIIMGTSVITISMVFLLAIQLNIPEHLAREDAFLSLLSQSIPTLVLLVLYGYRRLRKYERIHVQLDWKQYVLFYIGVVCSFLMLASMQSISSGNLSEKNINACGFAISAACVVFVILVLWQGIVVHREIQFREQNKLNAVYMESQAEHFRQIMEQDEKMRRFRHDINAHMAVLNAYCRRGDSEKIKDYLERITKESAVYDMEKYTGNDGVDAVIRQLICDAEMKQISVEIKGGLPQKTTVSVYDLCTVISNLIKNAVEACEQIEQIDQRKVKVEVGAYNSQIFITVKNTVEKEIKINGKQLITTKRDKQNHGLGSVNVANAVQKYDGELRYKCENGWFVVEIAV